VRGHDRTDRCNECKRRRCLQAENRAKSSNWQSERLRRSGQWWRRHWSGARRSLHPFSDGPSVAREMGCPSGKRGASDSRHTKPDRHAREIASNRRVSDSRQILRTPVWEDARWGTFLWPSRQTRSCAGTPVRAWHGHQRGRSPASCGFDRTARSSQLVARSARAGLDAESNSST